MKQTKNKRVTIRITDALYDSIIKASETHNVTMTKYILRLLYKDLVANGYLDDELGNVKADIYIR